MSRHPLTTTLALLLAAAQACKPWDFEFRVAEIIERLIDIGTWPDEKKADLYALLVESVEADDKLSTIETKVARALTKNEENFRG